MRFVTDKKSKKEYKEFLENHNRCNFQQLLEWAEVKKTNWKPEVILADIVTNLGYNIKDDAKDFKDEIQPRFIFRLDIKDKTEDEVMVGFKQKWR